MSLDKTFVERENLNRAIVAMINDASGPWGLECLRYEIRDIIPPASIKQAMEMQAEAEGRKRAEILTSAGDRQSEVNLAEGKRQSAILQAQGEAEAIRLIGVEISGGEAARQAASLRVAEQWVG